MPKALRLITQCLVVASVLLPSGASADQSVCETPPEELPDVLPEPIEACGTLVLSGDDAGYTRVTFPTGVTLDSPLVSGKQSFSVTGPSGFVGFAIVEDANPSAPAWLGGRLPASGGSRLFVEKVGALESYAIPAGDYRIYLLTEDEPAEVTFHFDELSGSVAVPARHPASYEAQLPDEYATTAAVPQLYTAGGSADIDGDGILYQAAWFEAYSHATGYYEACVYDGPPSSPWAVTPSCVAPWVVNSNLSEDFAGGQGGGTGATHLAEPGFHFVSHDSLTSGGRREWGQSIHVSTAADLDSIDSLALWLDL